MRSYLTSLGEHPMALLRGIAELRGVELTSNARNDAAAQLAAALAEPDLAVAAVRVCSPAAQAAWMALQAAGGRMKAAIFARTHGEIRPIGPGRLEREATWRRPEGPAEELWFRGLIFRVFADMGEGPLEYIYIPAELAGVAGAGLASPAPSAAAVLVPTQAPPQPRRQLNALAVDLCSVLATVRETPAQVDAAGRLRPAEAARLSSGLLNDDAGRLALLLTLARERGWLATDRARLVVNHQGILAWLRMAHWEQMRALFAAWQSSADWNDLRHVPGLQAEGDWHNDPQGARRAILDVLRGLAPEAWYALPEVVAHIKASQPDFQRPDGDYGGWYLKDAATGRYLSGFESWDEIEGRLVRYLIEGPLFWLGAVALGKPPVPQSAGSRLGGAESVFRLTRFGAAWLTGRTPADLPRPARLTVSDEFVVTAPLLCPLLDRFRLLRFTDPLTEKTAAVSENSESLTPTATRHRITRSSLVRARSGGVKAEAVREFLQRATGSRVAPKVAAGLARFDQQAGVVRVSRGAVLRVADASLLATLRADPVIAPLLGDLISAQAVLVGEAHLARLLTLLKESGYDLNLD